MKLSVFCCLLLLFGQTCALVEPVVAGIGAIGALVGGAFWYSRSNTCYVHSKDNAVAVSRNLSKALTDAIFGQHLVEKWVVRSLKSHLTKEKPQKALVLSFHGLTGTGKNYVAKFIANAVYPYEGVNSPHVHLIISTLHFPILNDRLSYKKQVQNWIVGNVTKCSRSIFIFDEIDKMPPSVIDGIKPFIDFHESVDGVDYRKAIFIFLSNTGGKQITDLVHQLWSYGTKREDITYEDLEGLVTMGAFNEDGGLKHSNIIQQNLVDHYVPFLPLERRHVRMCIEKELLDRGATLTEDNKNKILNSLQYWPDKKDGVYCTSGCKRVGHKIDLLLD